MTKEELLLRRDAILSAIEQIEKGAQEIDIGELRIRKPSINWLYDELRKIDSELAKASGTYNTRVVVTFV
ncbi:MAG: hypothetical protein N2745_00505 [Syntrophorhabdaceae bacterium]|nr:hypothetical protein [Syntrophorhabdaceae bacterium]